MEQKIFSFSRRFNVLDQYAVSFDAEISALNNNGWNVKQIVSSTFTHQIASMSYPVLVITILAERQR